MTSKSAVAAVKTTTPLTFADEENPDKLPVAFVVSELAEPSVILSKTAATSAAVAPPDGAVYDTPPIDRVFPAAMAANVIVTASVVVVAASPWRTTAMCACSTLSSDPPSKTESAASK